MKCWQTVNEYVRMSEALFELICLWDCTMTLQLTHIQYRPFLGALPHFHASSRLPRIMLPSMHPMDMHTTDAPALFSFLLWHIPFTPLSALLTFIPTVTHLMPSRLLWLLISLHSAARIGFPQTLFPLNLGFPTGTLSLSKHCCLHWKGYTVHGTDRYLVPSTWEMAARCFMFPQIQLWEVADKVKLHQLFLLDKVLHCSWCVHWLMEFVISKKP